MDKLETKLIECKWFSLICKIHQKKLNILMKVLKIYVIPYSCRLAEIYLLKNKYNRYH